MTGTHWPLYCMYVFNLAYTQWHTLTYFTLAVVNRDRHMERQGKEIGIVHMRGKKQERKHILYAPLTSRDNVLYINIMMITSNDSALEMDKKCGGSLFDPPVWRLCYLSVLYVRGALRLQQFCQGTTAVTAGSFAAWLSAGLLQVGEGRKAAYVHILTHTQKHTCGCYTHCFLFKPIMQASNLPYGFC